jgi:hypothetical protein
MYADVVEDIRSRGGICSERPRKGNAGRLGVVGLSPRALSSLDFLFSGSRNLGEGDRVGGPPSDSERAFDGDRDVVRRWVFSESSVAFTTFDPILANMSSFN